MPRPSPKPSGVKAVASKLPFYASGPIIYDADDNEVAECWNPRGPGSAEDNAKRMATATNSHAALVQALKAVQQAYQDHFENMPVAFQSTINMVDDALKLSGQED